MTHPTTEQERELLELLELAAKAAGYDTSHPMNRERMELDEPVPSLWIRYEDSTFATGWNPLESDADALRLAVKFGMVIAIDSDGMTQVISANADIREPLGSDPHAATRRAIVRAAAAIAKGEK